MGRARAAKPFQLQYVFFERYCHLASYEEKSQENTEMVLEKGWTRQSHDKIR